MRWILTVALLLLCRSLTATVSGQEPQSEQPAAAVVAEGSSAGSQDMSRDAAPAVAEIRACVDSYLEAFNSGKAEALALHWAEAGELVTMHGETLRGHDQLAESFARYFADAPDAKLELLETSIAMISPSVASETGIARVVVPGEDPTETQYQAIHVKTGAGWKIDRVTEEPLAPLPPSHYDKLRELEWMIGTWTSAAEGADVDVSCRWSTNQNFLVRTFRVVVGDQIDFEGTQIIGWDAHAGTIRSWVFDSDGGFGVGRWTGGEGRWSVSTLNVLPDGRRGSSTNVYELVDDSTVVFSSVGRQVDGELLPSIEPVTIVRTQSE